MEEKTPTVGQLPSGMVESGHQKAFEDPEGGRDGDIDIERIERVYR